MASVSLEQLTKKFADVVAVDELTLEIPDGQFVAILGPSGCGKTTSMNMIAGLEVPTSGDVLIGGIRVNEFPPGNRSVGFVFQNWAIFGHLSVTRNLEYGLRALKVSRAARRAEVGRIASLLQLEEVLDRRAGELSANQMQQVALGRSMIARPAIFLLDEPFSNLDAAFRSRMRAELKHLQRELGQTMIYVTHDQLEAISMADKIAVMNLGVLQQYDSPEGVYRRPANRFVAEFIGDPPMNVIDGSAESNGKGLVFRGPGFELPLGAQDRWASIPTGHQVAVGIRPEHVLIAPEGESGAVDAAVELIEEMTRRSIGHFRVGDALVRGVFVSGKAPRAGDRVRLALVPEALHVFSADGSPLVTPPKAETDVA